MKFRAWAGQYITTRWRGFQDLVLHNAPIDLIKYHGLPFLICSASGYSGVLGQKGAGSRGNAWVALRARAGHFLSMP